MLIHEGIYGLGLRCSIGVTTATAFCGVVGLQDILLPFFSETIFLRFFYISFTTLGNHLRREYTLMGDVVNTSARLMASTKVCPKSVLELGADIYSQ